MTDKEKIDKAIDLRQAVIDGGELYVYDYKTELDIINNTTDFAGFVSGVNDYTVRLNPEKIPLTCEDFMERFKASKPRDFYNNFHFFTVSDFGTEGVFVNRGNEVDHFEYSDIINFHFTDGDPCHK